MSELPDLEGVRFVAATPDLLVRVMGLLGGMKLPTEDIAPSSLPAFELALDGDGRIIGMAGLEIVGSDALLRSVAVAPDWRGRGLGQRLVARREVGARKAGVAAIYLLTTDAGAFFRRLGYEDIARDAVHSGIAQHPQFRGLCPISAQCLWKRFQ